LETAGKSEFEDPIRVIEENLKQAEVERSVRQCIESALEDTGFELYLQPIVSSETGKIVGAEALSRIKDNDGNIIPPGVFIPVAENSGRINGLGELVFDRTCKFIKENGLEKLGIEWINVNLSPLQFLCTDLADRYSAIVGKYGVSPQSVHLEITEEAMIDDSFLQKQIRVMGEKGFIFVLDDYGTGYSNLSRLKKCPFANVKLDMSIVWDYCREPDEILPNMIQALKNMGFSITAEGIEDENMVNIMKDIGCDFLQGYHYSKPVPADEFADRCLIR
jgi:EAL domain-containing protein (putative c-di-GMP-specific phosphodiesterase class I)